MICVYFHSFISSINFIMNSIKILNGCLGFSRTILGKPCFYSFAQPKFKVIEDPKEANKLVFDESGKCRIFEHKNGER